MPVLPGNDKDMTARLEQATQNAQAEKGAKLAKPEHHQAAPGPVIANAQDLGQPASKEDLKKRAEELNK